MTPTKQRKLTCTLQELPSLCGRQGSLIVKVTRKQSKLVQQKLFADSTISWICNESQEVQHLEAEYLYIEGGYLTKSSYKNPELLRRGTLLTIGGVHA